MKTELKGKAINLRKKGYSLKEIATTIGISKSTASLWVSPIPISLSGYNRLREKTQKALAKAHATVATRNDNERKRFLAYGTSLTNKYSPLTPNTAKVFAALLYWCEGGKNYDHSIKFANSDPKLIKFFLKCLRVGFSLREEKIRCLIHLHEYHNVAKQTEFWSSVTGVPTIQFHKPYLKPNSGRNIRPDYPGCLALSYYDKVIARELFGLMKALGNLKL